MHSWRVGIGRDGGHVEKGVEVKKQYAEGEKTRELVGDRRQDCQFFRMMLNGISCAK